MMMLIRRFQLEEHTIDKLLAGKLSPESAPSGYQKLAGLIQTAKGPAAASELANHSSMVSKIAQTARINHINISNSSLPKSHVAHPVNSGRVTGHAAGHIVKIKRKVMLSHLLSAKVASIIVAGALVAGTGTAAATGSLPAPVQHAVSSVLSNVGISVPNPNTHSQSTTNNNNGKPKQVGNADNAGKNSQAGKGLNANQHALYGLCTAYKSFSSTHGSSTQSGTGNSSHGPSGSTAFTQLSAQAKASKMSINSYCAKVLGAGESSNSPNPSTSTTLPTTTTEPTVSTSTTEPTEPTTTEPTVSTSTTMPTTTEPTEPTTTEPTEPTTTEPTVSTSTTMPDAGGHNTNDHMRTT
ncbi:MAG: hypothetical protein M1483_02280 [Actinobacteria bacterium]|nr:hypothetical protein [Actinomycetota bacterium]MCL6104456.1 hypothetical protein [Actinomycetota bacterium]